MNIEIIDSLPGLESLREEWFALWQSCPTATPFQSPQWLLPWTRHLFGGGEICSIAMYSSGKLAGFAPLFRWGTDRRTVSFLGAGISDYGDLLFAPGLEAECVSMVRGLLKKEEAVDLQEVRSGSGLRDGCVSEECSICPVLPLHTFPDAVDSKHRIDVRRARNKLLRDPDLRLSASCEKIFHDDLDEFFRLYEARWGALDAKLQLFHREAALAFLETGNLRLSLLRISGKAAAAIYAFTAGKTLYCYLSGFDPEMGKLSPGAVLLGWVIEQAVAEGLEEVDFLRDGEAYKYLWGARNRTNYAVRTAAAPRL